MNPKQRIFLQTAWEAIEDAGYGGQEIKSKRVGVYTGMSDFFDEEYLNFVSKSNLSFVDSAIPGNFSALMPSRLSYLLDLNGPSMVIDTACSSSLVAVHLACQALRNKDCEMALVGGVRINLVPSVENPKIGIESSDGYTRSFDAKADGTGIGEGSVAVILKPLKEAMRDKDNVLAVIKGTAINQDGNSIGITAPNAEAQADVIERACNDGKISIDTISYIETHGTGTKLGDPIEIDGIEKAFNKYTSKKQFCAIGSVKSNIGHTFDISGLVSLVKGVLALQRKKIPPTYNFNRPNPKINFQNSPVYVNDRLRSWENDNGLRRCGISSFGFSGTNSHVILEEISKIDNIRREESKEIFTISSKSKESLIGLLNKYTEFLRYSSKDLDLVNVCYTSNIGRGHYKYRLAIIANNIEQLREKLSKVTKLCSNREEGIYFGEHSIITSIKKKAEDGEITQSEKDKIDMESDIVLDTVTDESKLDELCNLYIKGANIKWNKLFENKEVRKVKLPVYEFEKNRCWVDFDKYKEDLSLNKKEKNIHLEGRTNGEYTQIEEKLALIFYEVMGFEKINIYDNFSNLGGDSLLLSKAHEKIEKVFSKKVAITDLFSHPTIIELAKFISDNNSFIKNFNEKYKNSDENIEKSSENDIAIIGISGKFPGARNISEYWENVKNGKEYIINFPEERAKDVEVFAQRNNTTYVKGGYINNIDKFDYSFFGLSPKEANLMDPSQRLFLQTAWLTLEDAGYSKLILNGSKTAIFVGYANNFCNTYNQFIQKADPSSLAIALSGNLPAFIASRLSYYLNLKGPSVVVDTTCSSSLVAVHLACKSIKNGECDMAIAGGVKINLLPLSDKDENIGIESLSYKTKTFDDKSDGTVSGEGVGAVLLKPLNKAIKDRDNIYAIIKGSSINQDGTSMGITAPNSLAQAEVINLAWKDAKINPETISYIVSHGTGTKLGDPIEIDGIKKAFVNYTNKKQFCAISSVKPNIGHLYEASGIANIIEAVLAIKNKQLPPSINFNSPNKKINFIDSPLYVNNKLKSWEVDQKIRRCGVSSFGLSGTNCHIVLEEFVDKQVQSQIDDYYERINIITISAKTQEALKRIVNNYIKFLNRSKNEKFSDICYTANTGRNFYDFRLAIVARNKEELKQKLNKIYEDGLTSNINNHIYYGDISTKKEYIDDISSQIIEEFIKTNDINKAKKLCDLFILGVDIDWNKLYFNEEKNKVSIPGYSFEKTRCWLDLSDMKNNIGMDELSKILTNMSLEKDDGIRAVLEELRDRITNCPHSNEKQVLLKGRETSQYTSDEQLVANVWGEVLGVNEININESFYAIGGDSILALKIADIIGKKKNSKIDIAKILINETIEKFARYLSDKKEYRYKDIETLVKKEAYLISPAQKRMFIVEELEKGTSYNIPVGMVIKGKVDKDKMEKAIELVIDRQEMLRTSFKVENEQILAQIHENINFNLEYLETNKNNLENIIREFVSPFNLGQAPLFRAKLIKISEEDYIMLLDMHHIISDWASIGILFKEIVAIYMGKKLPDLKVQYKDFADWQRKFLLTEELKRQEEYWMNVFSKEKSELPRLNLPTDYIRGDKSTDGEAIEFNINRELTEKISALAIKTNCTLYMILLSAYSILLAKYTAQDDIIIGSPISGRHYSDVQNTIGMFVNTLALRSYPKGDKTFNEFLREVKDITLKAYENQDYQFDSIIEKLELYRDVNRNPLFDTMFILQNYEVKVTECEDIKVDYCRLENKASQFDITFEVVENKYELNLEIEYCTKLFKRESIEEMAYDYMKILNYILDNTNIKLADIKIKDNLQVIEKAPMDVEFNF